MTTAQLEPIAIPEVEWSMLSPELILIGGALALLVAGTFRRDRTMAAAACIFTVAVAIAAMVASWGLWQEVGGGAGGARLAIADAVAVDGFAIFFTVAICCAVALGALLAHGYLRQENLEAPTFYVLMMLSASGGILMAKANDLILIFVGLEVLSIALYVLAGYHQRREQSREAAIKYFVLGSFSSAFFLYGVALTYGSTGSTNLTFISDFLSTQVVTGGVLLGGFAFLLVGLGFKVAAVPFHMWTPDVYQGAPTPVTGFMAAAAKAAGFAALLRIFYSAFGTESLDWRPIVWVLAVLSMVVGSVLAVVQTDVKRMLAYSSISHAGYVLIGLQAANDRGIAGSLFYLLAYTFMVLGSFAVVTIVGRRGDANHDLSAYRGLASRRPALALAFTVLLLSQAGVPFTTGFLAKFYVISAAVQSRSYALALIGMLSAVVAAFFYLRITVLMYAQTDDAVAQEGEGARRLAVPAATGVVVAVAAAFTIAFGLVPSPMIHFARQATLLL
jgi:NADH-quinone oxidoreductase subunit N